VGYILQQGRVIAAYGRLGEGSVLWFGANLPYHMAYYDNWAEKAFMVKTLKSMCKPGGEIRPLKISRPNYSTIVTFLDEASKGLVVKETYYPSWEAEVEDHLGRKRKLEIYDAGIHMMYICLPEDLHYPVKVTLRLRPDPPYYVGGGISIMTVLMAFHIALKKGKARFSKPRKHNSL